MINCFLLFHKCGNNYIDEVHFTNNTRTLYVNSVLENQAADISKYDKRETVVNVRCRNYSSKTIEKSGLLQIESARFLVFTREPASFILSAVKYHLRGGEKWAVENPQLSLGGNTLTQSLQEATSPDDQQIIIMKQFDWLYQRQISLLKYLKDKRFLRVRCEDLFTNTDEKYYLNIARFLRVPDSLSFVNALKFSSPAFKIEQPKHSTGVFKIQNAYNELGEKARDYYDTHWKEYEIVLRQ